MEDLSIDVSGETLEGFTENPEVEQPAPTTAATPDVSSPEAPAPAPTGEPQVIGTIKSSAYGGFTKIISLLTGNMGKADVIEINQGKLSTISGGGFLYCDLTMLFGENDFDIIDPQYNIKLMKLITGGDEVVFVDDDANSQYLISNLVDGEPQINITLPKPDPSLQPTITEPVLGESQEIIPDIDPDLVNTITTAEKNLDSQFFILSVYEHEGKKKIASIATDHKTFKYNFCNPGELELTEYKLFNPFPIPKPDEIDFELFESPSNELWVKTTSEVGMASVEYMEKLAAMGIFDSFSL